MTQSLIDLSEISPDGDLWEMFARDYLQELGFFIEAQPARGADGGKDLLMTEQLGGLLNNYRWRWLVSCKHFAKSRKAVSENEEQNIQERLDSFSADGFIGFYSTLPTSGLGTRLESLKEKGRIKDYRIFDCRLIENYLVRLGFSPLLMRYLPEAYRKIKPMHLIADEFIPLNCRVCGKELLEAVATEKCASVVASAFTLHDGGPDQIVDVYWACKGECDWKIEAVTFKRYGAVTAWEDISDLVVPAMFLRWVLATMNKLRDGTVVYTDEAYDKEKTFIMAMSQRVLREMTEEERQIAVRNFNMPGYV